MGWNPFKSKTKYYVSSSTFPLFDDKNRIDNYEAAILDYTSNSSIEQSEYLKNYYSTSRLRDIRGLLNWADSSGYHRTMGKVSATFYADAQLDNEILTIATKQYVSINPNDTYRVYKSNLNIFSEDFWLKHLATQQGKAQLFYESAAINYTVSFPTEDTIRATFKNGTVIEGRIPNNASRTRFIEMEYSIITEAITDKVDAEGNVVVDPETGKPVKITTYTYQYGYYDYQEGSGNTTLDDALFKFVTEYSPQSVGVEVTGQQGGFISWLQREMQTRNIWFNFATGSNNSPGIRPVTDKLTRFNIVLPWFKAGKIYWPEQMKSSIIMGTFMQQLKLTTVNGIKGHDDCIDTISMLGYLKPWEPQADQRKIIVADEYWEDKEPEPVNGMDSYIV